MTDGLVADSKRQANSSIRGYVYQAYQSILAWIRLGPDEVLYLEGAEDFDVHSNSHVTATQVKDTRTSGTVTLRSGDVVDAVNHYWEHQENNPSQRVRFRFLTTAYPGKEKGAPFEDQVTGIEYWSLCARDETRDCKPLLAFLQKLDLSKSLSDFLKAATISEFRERLLVRIDWDTGMRPMDGLLEDINNHLIFVGAKYGVDSFQAKKVLGSLLQEVMGLLSSEGTRNLTYADFVSLFERVTMELVPKDEAAAIRSVGQVPGHSMLVDLGQAPNVLGAPLPLLQGAVSRRNVVERLLAALNQFGVLILRGSTGLGKTSLARLVADATRADWVWAGFRGRGATQIADQLNRAAFEIKAYELPLRVVLDDLDLSAVHQYERELLALAFSVVNANGQLIITTQGKCPDDVLSKLWIDKGCDFEVPYLDETDIAELLFSHGLEDVDKAAKWARLIRGLTTGHPQLAHARVRNLQARGWPDPAAEEIISVPSDIDDLNTQTRKRLLSDVPNDPARVVAYRLSLVTNNFKRSTAMDVGAVDPAVNLPGEAFDCLVGPWVEAVGQDRFRISPLLNNVGKEVLPVAEQKAVHEAIAFGFIKADSISPDELGTGLIHAILAESDWAIVFLSQGIVSADEMALRAISDSVFWLSGIGLDPVRQVVANDAVEMMLRLAQFKVLAAAKREKEAVAVIEHVIELIGREDQPKLRAYSEVMAFVVFLSTINISIPPARSIRMLARLIEYGEQDEALADLNESVKKASLDTDTLRGLTSFQILFSFEAARISGISEFEELLQALDSIDVSVREKLVEVLEYKGEEIAHRLVSNAWWRDASRDRLDVETALSVYEKTIESAKKWGSPSLERAAYIAISVLHDEYRNDSREALRVLDRAGEKFSASDQYLLNQRAKVLFHKRDDAAAVQMFQAVLEGTSLDEIERAFAGRTGGIAAGRMNDWQNAEKLFRLAAEAADSTSQDSMAAGLWADTAFSLWKIGKKKDALQLYAEVLRRLEKIPENGSLRDRFAHAAVRHCIAWIELSKDALGQGELVEPVPGLCSTQEPREEIRERGLVDLSAVWGLLGNIDTRLGTGLGLSKVADEKCSGEVSLNIRLSDRIAKYQGLWAGVDTENAAKTIIEMMEGNEHYLKSEGDINDGWSPGDIESLESDFWQDDTHKENFKLSIVGAAIVRMSLPTRKKIPVQKWQADAALFGLNTEDATRFFELLSGESSKSDGTLTDECAKAIHILESGQPAPSDLFICHFRLLNGLVNGSWDNGIGTSLAKVAVRNWRFVIARQRFALRSPNISAEAIKSACNDDTKTSFAKVALILNAAHDAVGVPLAPTGVLFLNETQEGNKPT
ncbi:hypothetical protein KFF05_00440 [bacterium SCSIO 12827]|nr:hypothetical protein KFF05_00440 [bacterium SCSIO 12827]